MSSNRPVDGRSGQPLRITLTGGINLPARFRLWLLIPVILACVAFGDEEAEPQADRPGLVATWTDGTRTISQREARLAFRLSDAQSPHPQLASKQLSGTWKGRLFVGRPGRYRFSAEVRGELHLDVNGQRVLATQSGGMGGLPTLGADEVHTIVGEPVDLPYGAVALEAAFSKLPNGLAYLRLFWQRDDAHREPVPAWSLRHSPSDETEELLHWRQVEAGRRLAEEYRCVRCHVDDTETKEPLLASSVPVAPDLEGIGGRVGRNWIYHWLKRPRAFRPNATMPALFGDSPTDAVDLYALTEFLTVQGGPFSLSTSSSDPERAARGAQAFATLGCIACHRALGEKGDDVSVLRSLEGLASKTNAAGIRRAITDPWSHYPTSRMPVFQLDETQGDALEDLVHYLAAGRAEAFEQAPPSPPLAALARRFHELVTDAKSRETFEASDLSGRWRLLGNEVLALRGCLDCHPLGDFHSRSARPVGFSSLVRQIRKTHSLGGCLAPKPRAGVPDFRLTSEERAAIGEFLSEGTQGAGSVAPIFEAERRLDTLGCMACHERNGRGGLFAQRITRFVELESDTTVRDVAPPDLSGVGEKLRPKWLRGVIEHDRRTRPWMDLKMPAFAREAVTGLADGLIAADGRDSADERTAPEDDAPEMIETGRLLVGSTGFGCVSCHDIAGIQSTGVRGPDLAGVFDRIRRPWFTRWMLDPQVISPGTRMPSVFFDGKSAVPQLLGGEPDRQLEAMWAYLSKAKDLPLPEFGPSPGELVEGGESPTVVPEDVPLLVRGYLGEHGGVRGIALGFPEGTHFGFDSERCRLVSVWQGGFLQRQGWFDAGRGGAEKDGDRVLGTVIWQDAGDLPFAIEDDSDPASGTTALRHPSGARYDACWAFADEAGFAYRLQFGTKATISVEDRPAPLVGAEFPSFRRHLTLAHASGATAGLPGSETAQSDKSTVAPSGLWVRIGELAQGTCCEPFYDREGQKIELQTSSGIGGLSKLGTRSSEVRHALWMSCQIGTDRWLVSARGAPAGTRWVVREAPRTAEDGGNGQKSVELWLRLPAGGAEGPRTCGLTFIRITSDENIDFERLEALIASQRPLVGRR